MDVVTDANVVTAVGFHERVDFVVAARNVNLFAGDDVTELVFVGIGQRVRYRCLGNVRFGFDVITTIRGLFVYGGGFGFSRFVVCAGVVFEEFVLVVAHCWN